MKMKPETPVQQHRPRRHSSANKTLQRSLLAFFVLAATLLVFSHHAVYSPAFATEQRGQKLSVPPPRPRMQPAKGGLPPIPDSVAGQLKTSSFGNKDMATDDASVPHFPLPFDAVPVESGSSEIILQPTFGSHRPNRNAVFAFAEGYDLNVYVTFIESLKETNFTGDVVLAVSHVEGMKSGVAEYLKWHSLQGSLRVISYALSWECYKKSGARILPTNKEGRGSTTNHGFSDCKIDGLYSNGGGRPLAPARDPRQPRPVATARYELYWIFSRQYHEDSSVLIVDARDAYFQSNPFTFTPPASPGGSQLPVNEPKGCTLQLFAENYDAVNIGKSSYNSRWIGSAYGQKSLNKLSSNRVICSGSTMGTQRAIELYSTAMVAQFDKTKCKQVGCDQGFHNYLFYEGGLEPYLTSHGCVVNVHRQGDGAVNNLAAMRDTSLRSQGVLKSIDNRSSGTDGGILVLNNDKSTPSPVLHQFDRDAELKGVIRKRTKRMLSRWRANQQGLE